jgi:hypothetical protein
VAADQPDLAVYQIYCYQRENAADGEETLNLICNYLKINSLKRKGDSF